MIETIVSGLFRLLKNPKRLFIAALLLSSPPTTTAQESTNQAISYRRNNFTGSNETQDLIHEHASSLYTLDNNPSPPIASSIVPQIEGQPLVGTAENPGSYRLLKGQDLTDLLNLRQAINHDDVIVLQEILKKNPKLLHFSVQEEGTSPWLYAVQRNSITIVRYLYENRESLGLKIYEGSYIDSIKQFGRIDAYLTACENGHIELIEYFHDKGFRENLKENNVGLFKNGVFSAAYYGQVEALKKMKSLGIDLDNDIKNATPIIHVLGLADPTLRRRALEALLKAGSNPSAQHAIGNRAVSPLRFILLQEDYTLHDEACLLMDYGADLYEYEAENPLYSLASLAIEREFSDFIFALYKHNYDIFLPHPHDRMDLVAALIIDLSNTARIGDANSAILHKLKNKPEAKPLVDAANERIKKLGPNKHNKQIPLSDPTKIKTNQNIATNDVVYYCLIPAAGVALLYVFYHNYFAKNKIEEKQAYVRPAKHKSKSFTAHPSNHSFDAPIYSVVRGQSSDSSPAQQLSQQEEDYDDNSTLVSKIRKKNKKPSQAEITKRLEENRLAREAKAAAELKQKQDLKKEQEDHKKAWQKEQSLLAPKKPALISKKPAQMPIYHIDTQPRPRTPNKYVTAAIMHGSSLGEILALDDKAHSKDAKISTHLDNFALLYHIHRSYLAISLFRQQQNSEAAKKDIDKQLATDMRNIAMHKSISLNSDMIHKTAFRLKEILPRDIAKLRLSHDHKSALPETSKKELHNILGTSNDVISFDAVDQTEIYAAIHHEMNTLTMIDDQKKIEHPLTKDGPYLSWIIEHIIPMANEFAFILLKAPPKTEFRKLHDYAKRLDALKMLFALCGEFYHDERSKRFKAMTVDPELMSFMNTCRYIRNCVGHYFPDVDDSYLIAFAKKISRIALPASTATVVSTLAPQTASSTPASTTAPHFKK